MKKLLYAFLLFFSLIVLTGCNDETTAEYRTDLQSVADDLLANAAEAEDVLNQYAHIWKFSIESGTAIGVKDMANEIGLDEEVIREHFQLNSIGNVPGDFSINVNSLKGYFQSIGILDEIEQTSEDIKKKINELNNPPKGYEEVYDEVLDMYILVEEYTELALNPTGSLQSFNDTRGQLSNEILSKYKRIEVIMPSEE